MDTEFYVLHEVQNKSTKKVLLHHFIAQYMQLKKGTQHNMYQLVQLHSL
jgi:hypothetical protein